MEILYQVEKDDSVLGRVKREEAHANEILHRAGMVFIVRPDAKIRVDRVWPEGVSSAFMPGVR